MSPELIGIITGWISLAGMVYGLHREIGSLKERMARLEGLLEGFTKRGDTT